MKILKKVLSGIIVNGAALYVVVSIVDEIGYQGGWKFFVVAGIILGILNTIVKPILKLISLPFILISAGLFFIVINAVLLYLTKVIINTIAIADVQFLISGFGNYLIASVIFGIVNWILHIFFK